MKVLLYGHAGWIGSQFASLVESSAHTLARGTARCSDVAMLRRELAQEQPSHVVAMIGRTHGKFGDIDFPTIDYLEQPGKLADNVRDNLTAPVTLAVLCKEKDIHFTYMGTGCIFEYDTEHTMGPDGVGYTEHSAPNFTRSSYSTMKGATDQIIHSLFSTTSLNLRIRMPITEHPHPRNFITKITTYDKICSMPNSMTVLPTLLPCILPLMDKRVVGTLNFTNPGVISHNEILALYRKHVDTNFTWENFSMEDQAKLLASGRSNNRLDTTRLEALCPDVPCVEAAVDMALRSYKTT